MAGVGDGAAVFILQGGHRDGQEVGAGNHRFQGFPHRKLIPLGHLQPALLPIQGQGGGFIGADVPHFVVILIRLAEVEAGGVAAVAYLAHLLIQPLGQGPAFEMGQVILQGHAVGVGHHRHIVGGLRPALDLQAGHPGLHQFIQVLDHAQVLGVEDVGAGVRLLHNGEILPGALFLHQMVPPPAGLGALAPVGVPVGEVVGDQTPPGDGHTHGPVDEHFQLQVRRGFGPNLGDFLQAQLPGQHHPLSSQLIKGPGGLVVGDAGLGGDVQFQVGGDLLGEHQSPHIVDNHPIHPDLVQVGDKLGVAVDLVVALKGVGGDVHLHPFLVGQRHALGQLVRVKVGHAAPHPEFLSRQVDGVGAVLQGRLQPPQIPGRGKDLRPGCHALFHGVAPF